MKQKKPFIMLPQNFFERPEFGRYLEKDAATHIGVYVVLTSYLAQCDNCTGTLRALRPLAAKCNKRVRLLLDMLHDSNLFVIDEERGTFQCVLLNETMRLNKQQAAKSTEKPDTRAYLYNSTREDIDRDKQDDKDIEQDNKNKIKSTATAVPHSTIAEGAAGGDVFAESKDTAVNRGSNLAEEDPCTNFYALPQVEQQAVLVGSGGINMGAYLVNEPQVVRKAFADTLWLEPLTRNGLPWLRTPMYLWVMRIWLCDHVKTKGHDSDPKFTVQRCREYCTRLLNGNLRCYTALVERLKVAQRERKKGEEEAHPQEPTPNPSQREGS